MLCSAQQVYESVAGKALKHRANIGMVVWKRACRPGFSLHPAHFFHPQAPNSEVRLTSSCWTSDRTKQAPVTSSLARASLAAAAAASRPPHRLTHNVQWQCSSCSRYCCCLTDRRDGMLGHTVTSYLCPACWASVMLDICECCSYRSITDSVDRRLYATPDDWLKCVDGPVLCAAAKQHFPAGLSVCNIGLVSRLHSSTCSEQDSFCESQLKQPHPEPQAGMLVCTASATSAVATVHGVFSELGRHHVPTHCRCKSRRIDTCNAVGQDWLHVQPAAGLPPWPVC